MGCIIHSHLDVILLVGKKITQAVGYCLAVYMIAS